VHFVGEGFHFSKTWCISNCKITVRKTKDKLLDRLDLEYLTCSRAGLKPIGPIHCSQLGPALKLPSLGCYTQHTADCTEPHWSLHPLRPALPGSIFMCTTNSVVLFLSWPMGFPWRHNCACMAVESTSLPIITNEGLSLTPAIEEIY
jgi:hypothetical protein